MLEGKIERETQIERERHVRVEAQQGEEVEHGEEDSADERRVERQMERAVRDHVEPDRQEFAAVPEEVRAETANRVRDVEYARALGLIFTCHFDIVRMMQKFAQTDERDVGMKYATTLI